MKKMRKKVKKMPAPENVETKAKFASMCQKSKSRNTASERPMAAGDTEVDGNKSKVRKVKTRIVTRKRKTATDDGSCAIVAPGHIGVTDGHVTNTSEFEPSPIIPDCISPATKLAKQFKCFKEKQLSSLSMGGDATLFDVSSAGHHSTKDVTSVTGSTTATARKRRGKATQMKCLNAALPVALSFNTVSSGCSSQTDVPNNTDKDCRMKTGCKKGKNQDGSSELPDSSIVRKRRTNTCGDRVAVTRKRRAKRKVDTLVVETDAAKTTKRSSVDNEKNKSQRKPHLGKRQADVVCGPSDMAETDAGSTEGNLSVPSSTAGPSVEGEAGAGSSDSESDWEEVDELPCSNTSVKDQVPTSDVEIILQAPLLKKRHHRHEVDVKTYFRRIMNRYRKETQLNAHKVHLLCLLSCGFHRNHLCNDGLLQAVMLSLVPARFVDEVAEWDISSLWKITAWFRDHFVSDSHLPGNTAHSATISITRVTQGHVSSQAELVFIFVAMLRSLGLDVRLVISLQPVSIKATDLVNASSGKQKAPISLRLKNRLSTKEASKKEKSSNEGSSKSISKVGAGVGTKERTKHKFDKDEENKNEVVSLSSKIAAKCKLKKGVKKAASGKEGKTTFGKEGTADPGKEGKERVDNDLDTQRNIKAVKPTGETLPQVVGRPRRRVSRVNYTEGVLEKGSGVAETDDASEGNRGPDEKDVGEESSPRDGKRKGKCRLGEPEVEEKGYSQEISDDDDFVAEKVNMRVGKKTRNKRKAADSDDDDVVMLKRDGSDTQTSTGMDHWTEVFLPSKQCWICVDCVHARVAEPETMERHATSPISYVLALNNKNYVKDVTSKYASDWMHSTRKLRVCPVWWQAALAPYCDPDTGRESMENEEIKAKFTEEPLPKSIGQYKDHPLYALARHLLKFEAIYPTSALVLGYIRNEPVYSRECVHNLHSRETWMKEGLVVKVGEEPYKMVRARPKWNKPHENTKKPTLPIFGRWQTEVYVAPPAVDGKISVNEYGNVELFKSSMLPAGTIHVRVPGLQKVAKKLNLDCPAAMVGWDFHGGFNHPVMDGWVVCVEHKDILLAAWDEDQEIQRQRDIEKREARAVDNWKSLVKGLLIRQRLRSRYDLQESASGSVGNTDDTRPIQDTRPAGDTALSWPQNRRKSQTSDKLQNRGPLFPFEMEHM